MPLAVNLIFYKKRENIDNNKDVPLLDDKIVEEIVAPSSKMRGNTLIPLGAPFISVRAWLCTLYVIRIYIKFSFF